MGDILFIGGDRRMICAAELISQSGGVCAVGLGGDFPEPENQSGGYERIVLPVPFSRDGENINGGFLVGVGPEDFPGDDPLAGVRFQEAWELAAWELGTGGAAPRWQKDAPLFHAPAQTVGDFLAGRPSQGPGQVQPTYRPGVTWSDLTRCLPAYVTDTLREALPIFDRKVHGFAAPDAVLTGVETRSSSPVRILRGEDLQSTGLRGLYPCGEGAGYAGGIMSAAVDGVRVAEAVATRP